MQFLALPLITAWSSQEALPSLQLILRRIRGNKQPVNGGLNQEMELESAANSALAEVNNSITAALGLSRRRAGC